MPNGRISRPATAASDPAAARRPQFGRRQILSRGTANPQRRCHDQPDQSGRVGHGYRLPHSQPAASSSIVVADSAASFASLAVRGTRISSRGRCRRSISCDSLIDLPPTVNAAITVKINGIVTVTAFGKITLYFRIFRTLSHISRCSSRFTSNAGMMTSRSACPHATPSA